MFNLSTQTNLFLIVIAITTIINWICITIVFKSTGFISFTIYAVLSIPIYFLYIYNVNCLTYGNCELLSWIITIILSVSLIIVSVITIYLTSVTPENEKANISFSSLFTKPIEIKEIKPTLYTLPSATLVPPATAATPVPSATPSTTATIATSIPSQEEVIPTMEDLIRKQTEFINNELLKPDLKPEEIQQIWAEIRIQGEFLNKELLKPDLKPEKRQEIWTQILQLFYFINKIYLYHINKIIALRKDGEGPDLSPEQIQELGDMKILHEILYEEYKNIQNKNIQIDNLLPQLEKYVDSELIYNNLNIYFLRQKKSDIDWELRKSELQLPMDQRKELQHQLLIVTKYIIRFERDLQFGIIHQIDNDDNVNLKSEQRQLLWQQLLELILERYEIAVIKIKQDILKPELQATEKQKLENLIIIFERFITLHYTMRMQNFLPQLKSDEKAQIVLKYIIDQTIVRQRDIIGQELLKQEIINSEKEALQQQLNLLNIYSMNVLDIGDIKIVII